MDRGSANTINKVHEDSDYKSSNFSYEITSSKR